MNLSVDNESFRHIEWRNVNNETIGTQENINVSPGINNDRFSVAAVTEQGEIGMASISFDGAYGIESLSGENTGKLKVTFCDAVETGCQLMVSSVADGQKMLAAALEDGAEETTLDVSMLASGIYAVSLVKYGEVIDTKCFTKK